MHAPGRMLQHEVVAACRQSLDRGSGAALACGADVREAVNEAVVAPWSVGR